MKNKVFAIGEALIDLIPTKSGNELKDVEFFYKAPGGAPANVAAAVAKLGEEARFIGKLGFDSFGDFIIQVLNNERVSDECISRTSLAKTGLAFVALKKDGERDFMFYRNPSADMLLSKEDIHREWFNKGDILHYGSISLIQNPSKEATHIAIQYAREKGALISFDPNIRLPLWANSDEAIKTIIDYIPYADIIKISEEELEMLTGKPNEEGISSLFIGNVKLILLTLGSNGSVAYTKNGKVKLAGFKVKAIDTTGAGDSFIGAVLYRLVGNNVNIDNFDTKLSQDLFLQDLLLYGNANGALTSTKKGAISALSNLSELISFLNSYGYKELTLEKANKAVYRNYDEVSKCHFRLNYHIAAPTSWMNDPNGLIQFNGEYHVFYQHYPYSANWGPMHWGHVVSKDLVHWEHKPIALAPDTEYEGGCFSGSAVDDNGILTLIYTAHREGSSPKQVQCIATSTDGITFSKISNNPVISNPPEDGSEDFRDPKVWKHDGKWYMIVGTGKEGIGKAVLYSSANLRTWQYLGVVCESNGSQGDIWECPDLFELEDKHIILVSPMNMKNGKNIFIIGNMDYTTNKFTQLKYHEADYGDDFYAAQSFIDDKGRRILIAWMDMWGEDYPTQKNGWVGAMTIPRELILAGDKVISRPVEELKQLRDNEIIYKNLIVKKNCTGYLSDVTGDSLEIQAKFKAICSDCSKFGFILRSSKDFHEKTLVYYDFKNNEFVVDKSQSGEGNKNINKVKMNLSKENTLDLQIFIDKSSVEVFVNGGEVCFSNRIYPLKDSIYYDVFTEDGDIEAEYINVWTLKSGWC